MGAVHFSIDVNLVRCLKQAAGLDVFVETGTFQGDSVASVLGIFEEIHSVELSGERSQKASRRFADHSSVTIHPGDSPEILRQLKETLKDRAVLYWLDAHGCCGEGTAGENFKSPLIEELAALEELNDRSALLIDDARYYLSPLPAESNGPKDGPYLQEVLAALRSLNPNHEMMVLDDVLLFFPRSIRKPIRDYSRQHATDLLAVMHKTRDYENLRNQWKMQTQIMETLQARRRGWFRRLTDRLRGRHGPDRRGETP